MDRRQDSRRWDAAGTAAERPAHGAAPAPAPTVAPMVDRFGRPIHYLRVSVTDRCDFRCVYCMAETMTFLPRAELLTLEELDRVCTAFVGLGVRKLRLTGGEPLVRRNILDLVRRLSRHLDTGALDELTLTTNGSRLADCAAVLAECGVRRINVSLDTRDPDRFAALTRYGRLDRVLAGIAAAAAAGIKVKINTVALKGVNEDELDSLVAWCGACGFDLTLIEVMPLGEIGADRATQHLPLSVVRTRLERRWRLTDLTDRTGGPARYVRVGETGGRLGFITPLSHNFCESCNRVRLTCTGTVYLCLGQNEAADLRAPLRDHPNDDAGLVQAIRTAVARKPERHGFLLDRPAVPRPMSVTGG